MIKKLSKTILLSAVCLLGFSVSALAADTASSSTGTSTSYTQDPNYIGTAVVDENRPVSLTIYVHSFLDGSEKYVVPDGSEYDISELGEGYKPVEGATFKITQIGKVGTIVPNGDWTQVDKEKYPDLDNPFEAEFTSNEEGVAKISSTDGLVQGVYLVKCISGMDDPMEETLIYLPFTNPMGSGLLYDMKIYPKTSRPADPSSEEPSSESSSVSTEEKTQIAQLGSKQQMLFVGGILLLISSLSFLIFKNSKKNEA